MTVLVPSCRGRLTCHDTFVWHIDTATKYLPLRTSCRKRSGSCPASAVAQTTSAFILLVRTSASWSLVGTQCNGGRIGRSGDGSALSPWTRFHWWWASETSSCRMLAKSSASLFLRRCLRCSLPMYMIVQGLEVGLVRSLVSSRSCPWRICLQRMNVGHRSSRSSHASHASRCQFFLEDNVSEHRQIQRPGLRFFSLC